MNGVRTPAPVRRPRPSSRPVSRRPHQPQPLPEWAQLLALLLCVSQFCQQVACGGNAFDSASFKPTQTVDPRGTTTNITYDALNRLLAMTESDRTTVYGYDLNGNITKKTLPNGDVETDTFDTLNRATDQVAVTGGSVNLYDYQYGYDLTGNVTSVTETYPAGLGDRTVTNTYDTINRLLVESVTAAVNVVTTYAYDAANNRMSKAVDTAGVTDTTTYTYNNLNQLVAYGDTTHGVSLTYDKVGNRSMRTVFVGTGQGTDTYSYDFENRLIGLVKTTAGGPGTYAYQYDYRTRRITRDESNAGGVSTQVIFSGGTSVQEYDNGNGTPTVEYVRGSDYGGGVGGILYTLRTVAGTLTPSYTHENKRGDVIAKTDATGSLTYQAQYEAFGNQTGTTGSTLDRQKSNSKDTDPTGLVDEGFRYRDLETGEFITRDPAGFIDGPNMYTYVVDNPWTRFDPEGLTVGDEIQGYAEGVTNSVIDIANTLKNAPSLLSLLPNIPHSNLIGQATDKQDFLNGRNGGEVFVAGGSACIGGAEVKGEQIVAHETESLLKTGEQDLTKIPETPKPAESTPPGTKSQEETKKPYSDPNSRPDYAKGQVDEVWENGKGGDGKVYDPNTDEELTWDKSTTRKGQWDMGHKPGKEYSKLHKDYMDGKISKEDFLKEYRNPDNYQPESPAANQSHKYEQKPDAKPVPKPTQTQTGNS